MNDIDTSTADASGDAGTETDWPSKYNGLMRVAERRSVELTTAQQALAEKQAREAELEVELETYGSAARAAQEESEQEAAYEALRAKFEPEAPTPRGSSPARDRADEARIRDRGSDPFAIPHSKAFPV